MLNYADKSFFFFNDTATTEIYTLSLHDALPISNAGVVFAPGRPARGEIAVGVADMCQPAKISGLRGLRLRALFERGDEPVHLRVGRAARARLFQIGTRRRSVCR